MTIKQNNFWDNLPKPFFILAPMESVTDIVFRHVIASAARPDVFFTEFVNASSYCSEKGVHSTKSRLLIESNEQPIVAQIWGNRPDQFEKMSLGLAKTPLTGIDINMGCPVKAVVRNGSGCALIRTPEVAGELISAAKAGGLPVSVKTRIGDVSVSQWHDWIKFLLEQDVANLTVHLRTRKEMSKVGAHYELIPEIMQLRDKIAPKTLITINGDVNDRQSGEELVKKYGIDGVMIGRGVFTNPFAFEHVKKDHSRHELIELLNLHLDLYDKYSTLPALLQGSTLHRGSLLKFDPLKRFFKIYIRDFPDASELRNKLMHAKNTDEARDILSTSTLST